MEPAAVAFGAAGDARTAAPARKAATGSGM